MTDFDTQTLSIEDPEFVLRVLGTLPRAICTASEAQDIAAQCGEEQALCFACEDGMFVVRLQPLGDDLELFVLAAVGFVSHGAFERQEPAVLAIARDLGADTVAFRARRRGWGRMLGPEWSRRGTDEFVRGV